MFEVLSEGKENSSTYSPIFKFNNGSTPVSGDPGGITPIRGEQMLIEPTILFSNDSGTKETITLSQPYTDFSRIGVYAKSFGDFDSVYNEIYTSTNKMILASTSFQIVQNKANYDMVVWRLAHINSSGNTISFVANGAASFPNGNNKEYFGGQEDGLKIVRVVGYK